MLKALGLLGGLGVVLLLGGLGLLAFVNPLIAAGVAAVVFGLGLVIYGVISTVLGQLGMSIGDAM
jgi:uncharacterized membrane protein HdeD (DUF308 family)